MDTASADAQTKPELETFEITSDVYDQMVAHCLGAYPYEGCGLLAGEPASPRATACYPARNAAESSRVYTVDPHDHLLADRDAEAKGLELNAVFHSHTHTAAYPSPTDVSQALVPEWRYILVSFEEAEPTARSFRIVEGKIREEMLVVLV